MSDTNKKKEYDPPRVKEIGGIFEQARGVSQCTTGSAFSTNPCAGGVTPAGGCPGGPINQGCFGGGTDGGGCARGFFVSGGGCTTGTAGG